ncbi:MAG: DUF4214 domain-containing protein [Undibacterium sp.]|nr:DUF4214 domain-containing protein [Undibacterium sp.]
MLQNNYYQPPVSLDTTPPTLLGIKITSSLDADSGFEKINFSANATDASGIKNVIYHLDRTLNIGDFFYPDHIDIEQGWDDSTPTEANSELITDRYTHPGIYTITSVDVQDKAGNLHNYTNAELKTLGQQTSFTVTNLTMVKEAFLVIPWMNSDKMALQILTSKWTSNTNTLAFTLNYDSSVVHFESWKASSTGSYSVSTSVSEVGAVGTLNFSASIDNGGNNLDIVRLEFSGKLNAGTLDYYFSGTTVNKETIASSGGHFSFSLPPVIDGTALADTLVGGVANEIINGMGGNDRITGGKGSDAINGGDGLDTAVYVGKRIEYEVKKKDGQFTVGDHLDRDGLDTLDHVERLLFNDGALALDTDGAAGQAYRLYQAAFDRKPDLIGLGYWINAMDKLGFNVTMVAASFFESSEFQNLYGKNLDNSALVNTLYHNVLHREPEKAGFDFWVNALNDGIISRAGVLASFCDSTENQALVIGSIQNGIEYTLWQG